jgi:Na+/H+ antiporter NhaD/arsenite permease-like protein
MGDPAYNNKQTKLSSSGPEKLAEYLWNKICRDPTLAIAALFAMASCFIIPPDTNYETYIDYRTLALLFCLMVSIEGLSRAQLFSAAGNLLISKVRSSTGIILGLVLLTFISASLITNDVSLIAFIPFALLVLRISGIQNEACFVVVMMTVAANLGSMLTPIGNPQNLYLYAASNMNLIEFISLMLPYVAISGILLVATVMIHGRVASHRYALASEIITSSKIETSKPVDITAVVPWSFLFLLCLLVVAHLLSILVLLICTSLYALLRGDGILKQVDYALLLTFLAFFVLVGNISRVEAIHTLLSETVIGNELLVCVITSQIISNVPAAILLSGFSHAYSLLIVGTNLGGLGMPIASMASLISYKQIVRRKITTSSHYLFAFLLVNVFFLGILLMLASILRAF